MKIAITTDGDSIRDRVDQIFGRCRNFLVMEIDGIEVESEKVIPNEGAMQGHGAGIRAAEQMGELGIEALITGKLGPNATKVLQGLGIKAYFGSGVIIDVVNSFADGKLKEIKEIGAPHSELKKPDGAGISNSEEKFDLRSERVFFPLLNNAGMDSEISEHFGHAPFFGLYDVQKKELRIIANDLDHTDPNKSPIDQIQEAVDPTTIFAKGIGNRAIGIIKEKDLCLKTGNHKTVGEAIAVLDKLKDLTHSCGH